MVNNTIEEQKANERSSLISPDKTQQEMSQKLLVSVNDVIAADGSMREHLNVSIKFILLSLYRAPKRFLMAKQSLKRSRSRPSWTELTAVARSTSRRCEFSRESKNC